MKKHSKNNERGIALLFVLFALLLLTAIAASLMYMTDTEVMINSNYRASQQSYFASRAGLEEVRARMQAGSANTINPLLPGDLPLPALPTMPGAGPNGVVYVINQVGDPVAVTPWVVNTAYGDTELCHDYNLVPGMADAPAGQPCNSVPLAPNWYRTPVPTTALPVAAAGVLPYKWARVTWKANQSVEGYAVDSAIVDPVSPTANQGVCWDGGRERVIPVTVPPTLSCQAMTPAMTPVYLITSLAVTQTGARRITQMEVAKNIVRIPSALTLDGDNARTTFGTPTSAKFGISGKDACTGAILPGIGVVSPADDTGVTAELFRPSNYDGEGGAPSVIDLTIPSNPPRLEGLETVGDLKKLVGDIMAQAVPPHIIDMASPPPTIPSFGTPGDPSTSTVTIIKGDYPGPCDGQGVLVVTGNLTCGGNTKFEGLILVVGKGHFQADGGGNGFINGALLVANLFDETGKPLPDSSKPGIPTFDWNGGGTNFIQYDSCKILDALNKAPYRLLAMREVNY